MDARPRASKNLIWVGLALTAALLVLTAVLGALQVRSVFSRAAPVYGQVAGFSLTNQTGQRVTLADLRGKVWIADIIFTRCAGPCLKMSKQFKELQTALTGIDNVRLVSLTTDPEYDTPQVLARYGERFGAEPQRWLFLTGAKQQIAELARGSLKLTAIEKQPQERENAADLFIHSTVLVLVDKHGQLRGVVQTTGEGVEPAQVKNNVVATVRRLARER